MPQTMISAAVFGAPLCGKPASDFLCFGQGLFRTLCRPYADYFERPRTALFRCLFLLIFPRHRA
jgi:hypothetical protein